jgi:uncharacterized protein (TIGR00730 family)
MTERRRIAVFCGAAHGTDRAYRDAACALGATIAERGLGLVYGGASVGLMGALADAALSAGGEVIGVIPDVLVEREIAHSGLTELVVVRSMHERKARMARIADAFVALPGGFGTLDELFEITTWAQLGLHRAPIGLLDVADYYRDLVRFVARAHEHGFVKAEHRELWLVSQDPARLIDALTREVELRTNR